MNTYQTEEQKIDALRQFWKNNGRFITTLLVVTALCVAGFRYYRHQQLVNREQASDLYATMVVAHQQQDIAMVMHRGHTLHENYKKVSPYPELASLLMSKAALDDNKAQDAIGYLEQLLQDYPKSPMMHIARTRLARLKQAQGDTEGALQLLDNPTNGYTALYQEVKGDILLQSQRIDEAKAAYQVALDAIPPEFKSYLELKLQDIEHVQRVQKDETE